MEQLVREGKVLYVGSSNFAGLHIAQAQFAAEKRNFLGLVSEQSLYNLNARTIELEAHSGLPHLWPGVDPVESAGRGLVGRRACKRRPRAAAQARQRPGRIEKHRTQLEAYEALCRELGESRPMSGWPGCCTTQSSPRPSSARARWSSTTNSLRAVDITLPQTPETAG